MTRLLMTLLFCSILVSCGQTKTNQKSDKIEKQNQTEHKYKKVISDPTNKLTDKVENIEVTYHVIGCACPNWIRTKDEESTDTTKSFKDFYFYIEPADSTLELPIYFDAFRHRLKITGQFYEREDYPQGTIETEELMPKAKVFRYSNFEVIDNPNFKPDNKVKTLTLTYGVFACTCAQWGETRFSNDTNEIQHYWLEPANENLINADNLFDGENVPVIVKVTGQVVTENGFPKRELAKVGKDEAGKVFRYTEIKVIQNGQKKNGR